MFHDTGSSAVCNTLQENNMIHFICVTEEENKLQNYLYKCSQNLRAFSDLYLALLLIQRLNCYKVAFISWFGSKQNI